MTFAILLLVFAAEANSEPLHGSAPKEYINNVPENMLPWHHPRSMIGQDPITQEEWQLCNDLQWQANYGPLSRRTNPNPGSIGTCHPKNGVCVVYWEDTGLCDVIEQAPKPKKRKVTKQNLIESYKIAVQKCWSGEPMFGPKPSCEQLEEELWNLETKRQK